MELKIESLKKATLSLEKAINVLHRFQSDSEVDEDAVNTINAGVIQNFEFVYEQSWKMMKRWIKENRNPEGLEGITMREMYRLSAESILIDDVDKWMEFHKGRNLSSHTYDEDIAEDVVEIAIEFLPYAKSLVERLENKK